MRSTSDLEHLDLASLTSVTGGQNTQQARRKPAPPSKFCKREPFACANEKAGGDI